MNPEIHKICIWMNIPSHHQSAFFEALDKRSDVDLEVRYFERVCEGRLAEGWSTEYDCASYEAFVDGIDTAEALLETVPEATERTHVICGYFSEELIDYFCKHAMAWIHWSEMSGIRLAELVRFRTGLFRLLNPLMLRMKRTEGQRIAKHAVGAFGQGELARRALVQMGVPNEKIADLFYVPAPLIAQKPAEAIVSFARGRKVFLSVAALCRRKGIDLLLKAFAQCKSNDWVLVFCGLDKSDGAYQHLAETLGIADRVLFMGTHPVDRIAEVFAASDVLVLASRFDGWGAVMNEAASLGLPMIGTDLCGAAWHLVENGKTGFRVRAGRVGALANAMEYYVKQPEQVEVHGRATQTLFERAFTPECNAKRMAETLSVWKR